MTDDLGSNIGGMIGLGLTAGLGLAAMGMVERMADNVEEPQRKKKKKQKKDTSNFGENDLFDMLF